MAPDLKPDVAQKALEVLGASLNARARRIATLESELALSSTAEKKLEAAITSATQHLEALGQTLQEALTAGGE